MDSASLASQAKDSDDEEEVVHVDRDHFMDEFFEQVTELPMLSEPEAGPQPTTSFALFPSLLSTSASPWPLNLARLPEP